MRKIRRILVKGVDIQGLPAVESVLTRNGKLVITYETEYELVKWKKLTIKYKTNNKSRNNEKNHRIQKKIIFAAHETPPIKQLRIQNPKGNSTPKLGDFKSRTARTF